MTPVIGIVDDDASILRAVRRLLGAAGFNVRTFGSAEEFLLRASRADQLPGAGHPSEWPERLRAAGSEAHITIPIVFITAHDDLSTRERAQRGGASEYLRKPFDEHSLIGTIGKALGRASSS